MPAQVLFPSVVFGIIVNGKTTNYTIETGCGYFISDFRRSSDKTDILRIVDKGIPFKRVQPLLKYLNFGKLGIAKTLGVSKSTVSRWKPDSIIRSQRLICFFKIDTFIRKGVKLFGDEQSFKEWLSSPHIALGNQIPLQVIASPFGLELLEGSLEAMNYGVVL